MAGDISWKLKVGRGKEAVIKKCVIFSGAFPLNILFVGFRIVFSQLRIS
jgi:hypothetical protein